MGTSARIQGELFWIFHFSDPAHTGEPTICAAYGADFRFNERHFRHSHAR
jgi:hypothetical protein